uniref:DDE-1 domain-containing protein n=1 Tax=Trichuris muris TaxID=70415 RepID=A0A5S6QX84_TRIMR
MKRQKDAKLSYAKKTEEAGCSDRKIMRTSSGPLLCKKAVLFNAQFVNDKDFKASQGWLEKFHGIRCHTINGEKLSADEGSAEDFRKELRKFLDEGDYDFDFDYNAHETGLNWKALPTQSLVERSEENAPGYKSRKERVTIMLCANSTGSHRLPLHLIGTAKNPRSFMGVKSLLVAYGHQKAWMNFHLVEDWMKKVFVLEVKRYQEAIGKTGKVLLLIDNAPAHPVIDLLNSVDELVTVKFFPPNVISLIQPMDQECGQVEGIIEEITKVGISKLNLENINAEVVKEVLESKLEELANEDLNFDVQNVDIDDSEEDEEDSSGDRVKAFSLKELGELLSATEALKAKAVNADLDIGRSMQFGREVNSAVLVYK